MGTGCSKVGSGSLIGLLFFIVFLADDGHLTFVNISVWPLLEVLLKRFDVNFGVRCFFNVVDDGGAGDPIERAFGCLLRRLILTHGLNHNFLGCNLLLLVDVHRDRKPF